MGETSSASSADAIHPPPPLTTFKWRTAGALLACATGIAAKEGSTHPMIWIWGIVFFFLPQAAVVTYCVRQWPLEGGVYQWAKFALGREPGSQELPSLLHEPSALLDNRR